MPEISRPAFIRTKVLEVLSVIPDGRRLPVDAIQELVNRLINRDVLSKQLPASEPEMNTALGKLLDKGQAAYLVNKATELPEYHITMPGRQALQD